MLSVGLKSTVRKPERESMRGTEGEYNMSMATCGTTTTQVESPKPTPALTAQERYRWRCERSTSSRHYSLDNGQTSQHIADISPFPEHCSLRRRSRPITQFIKKNNPQLAPLFCFTLLFPTILWCSLKNVTSTVTVAHLNRNCINCLLKFHSDL